MMNPIYEISAAPHMPYALRTGSAATLRPEALVSVLMLAVEGHDDVRITERDGELFIAISGSM